MAGFSSNVVVITNDEPLGASVQRLLRARLGATVFVSAFTYVESLTFLTPARMAGADFFVLELFRHYRGGLRAEGVVLAQRLSRHGKKTLVISPLSIGQHKDWQGYWDVGSSDALEERLRDVIQSANIIPLSELSELYRVFSAFLILPPQHEQG